MGRRIDVELTSAREDGLWTWRAAGARQPRGELAGTLLYDGAKVGDVVRVEAEFHVDGIEVTEVFAPKSKRERTDLLELKPRPIRDDELVTTQRVRRDDRPRGDRRPRHEGDRPRGDRRPRREDHRRERAPEPESRPKPKRLRPRRAHREALLATVSEEHQPIVEQLIRDGMPGVRAAIDKQNQEAREAGKPEIDAAPIIAIAERNLQKVRLAEWRDRADAALAMATDLDLRDLRSVVVAGNDVARDEESRQIVDQLRAALDERVEADHVNWLDDLQVAVGDGRVVRALRLSSRPVKAGAPLPAELASTLAGQAAAALAPDTPQERWATVLDALAFSPVRGAVVPVGVPSEPDADLLTAVRRLADRIPAIATLFGVDPAEAARANRKRGPRRDGRRRPAHEGGPEGASSGPARTGGAESAAPDAGSEPSTESPAAPTPTAEDAAAPPAEVTAEPTTTEPEAPAEPAVAAEPEAPAEPDASTEPQAPAEPAAATEPEAPAEPAAATEPEAPAEPVEVAVAAEPQADTPEAEVAAEPQAESSMGMAES